MLRNLMNSNECQGILANIFNKNEKIKESYMDKKLLCPEQSHQNKLKIIFQFPPKSANDDLVKNEVKSIMSSALQEQLHTLTS